MKTRKINSCCKATKTSKCKRKDGKVFKLPRRFSRKACLTKKVRGFSMKSSCAPYKYCKKTTKRKRTTKRKGTRKKKIQFLYNPKDPKRSFDVYVDKNPKDTIPVEYKTVEDLERTIEKLEKLFKDEKYSHQRIWQVGMIIYVRLGAMNKYKKTRYPNAKNVYKRYMLSKKYFKFLGERTKKKTLEERKAMVFNP